MYIITQDELSHYGVKGMKWGVRKDNRTGSGGGRNALKTYLKITNPWLYASSKRMFNNYKRGAEFIKAKTEKTKPLISKKARNASTYMKNVTGSRSSASVKKYRRKNIDGMSDADLRKAVNRMNLERQYRDLTRADLMSGQRAAQNALKYNTTYKSVRKLATKGK